MLIKYSTGTLAVDCVITTGGTGMCPRDVTPEVVRSLIDRETPGITTALLVGSLKITPMAMSSRLTSGIRNRTLIICFPGSTKACQECFDIISPTLRHCIDQVKGDLRKVSEDHCCSHEIDHKNITLDPRTGVAYRPRHSQFEMLEVQKALEVIKKVIPSNNDTLNLGIQDIPNLIGKVLAQDVISPENIPPFPASVKDGYAVLASDGVGMRKVMSNPATAGVTPDSIELSPGSCVRISTGAPIPRGADCVVQVEDTELIEASSDGIEMVINIKVKPTIGQDIRPVGCDIEKGECILSAGCVLGPAQLGIIASIGVSKIKVIKPPLIGLLSTGDEIIGAGGKAVRGKIWDSNKTLLSSLLVKHNFKYMDFGIVRDDYNILTQKLRTALDSDIQVLITTGGVSMGEKDLLKSVFVQEFGAILHFGRVNMKPGKPTTFLTCNWNGSLKLIFGLPGNPVSTHVTFSLFVLPTIQTLSGIKNTQLDQMVAKLSVSQPLKLDTRPEYARGILTRSGIENHVHLVKGSQRSSRLMSTNGADVLVMLPALSDAKKAVNNGDIVSFISFD